ncbi:MAG: type II toxin-antitoxin system HicA family toxin [Planctomycetota bacterium]
MSELPSVNGKQAISAFENNGFAVVRVSASHRIMKKPGHRFVLSVPLHGKTPLKKGLLRGLISAAGKTVDQFLEDLD